VADEQVKPASGPVWRPEDVPGVWSSIVGHPPHTEAEKLLFATLVETANTLKAQEMLERSRNWQIGYLRDRLSEARDLLIGCCENTEDLGPWGDDEGTIEARICDNCGQGGPEAVKDPKLAHTETCPYGRVRVWLERHEGS